jgi:amidophosphoribosyltransferase
VFKDKRVILVDDSIVRGTTLRKRVRMVRAQGALEVHGRIGSPVTKNSCFYGVDTPSEEELIGARMDVDGIRGHIEADTLQYITVEGMAESVNDHVNSCHACFDGQYPIPVTE